jgi:D-arabinose 5-phosphate isomerase GutQ
MNRMTSEQLIEKAKSVLMREAGAVGACVRWMDESLAGIVALLLDCRGHVLVAGAGTSRAVALRFAHLLSCCGTPALPINAADALHGGAGAITDRDVVYIISKGGQSAEINRFADIARKRGAKIIAHTGNPDSPLAKMSDLVYRVAAEDGLDPYGMIATGSSLVNCAACDALCILLLELRGYSKKAFGETHPEGAVGKKLAAEGRNTGNDR